MGPAAEGTLHLGGDVAAAPAGDVVDGVARHHSGGVAVQLQGDAKSLTPVRGLWDRAHVRVAAAPGGDGVDGVGPQSGSKERGSERCARQENAVGGSAQSRAAQRFIQPGLAGDRVYAGVGDEDGAGRVAARGSVAQDAGGELNRVRVVGQIAEGRVLDLDRPVVIQGNAKNGVLDGDAIKCQLTATHHPQAVPVSRGRRGGLGSERDRAAGLQRAGDDPLNARYVHAAAQAVVGRHLHDGVGGDGDHRAGSDGDVAGDGDRARPPSVAGGQRAADGGAARQEGRLGPRGSTWSHPPGGKRL